jgi:hypothetical protein
MSSRRFHRAASRRASDRASLALIPAIVVAVGAGAIEACRIGAFGAHSPGPLACGVGLVLLTMAAARALASHARPSGWSLRARLRASSTWGIAALAATALVAAVVAPLREALSAADPFQSAHAAFVAFVASMAPLLVNAPAERAP